MTQYQRISKVLLLVVVTLITISGVYGKIPDWDTTYMQIDLGYNNFSHPVNPSFASFSIEWVNIFGFMGEYPNISSEVVSLIGNLKKWTGASPVFRIGGDSTDYTWYRPYEMKTPSKFLLSFMSPAQPQSVAALANILDAQIVLGLNFIFPMNITLAVWELQLISETIGFDRIKGFEIGNEVDLFPDNGIRERNYSYYDYKSEFEFYVNQLTNFSITNVSLPTSFIFQGATWCCNDTWLEDYIASYFEAEKGFCPTYSVHYYPQSACGGPFTPNMRYQLENEIIEGAINKHYNLSKAAISVGREYWIGESNSVSCGGYPNVSDVYGVALWAVDYMFAMATLNVSGINFHWGGYYTYFTRNETTGQLGVRPLFYGLWLFVQTVQSNSIILQPLNLTHTNPYLARNMNAYVAIDQTDSTMRVIVINKNYLDNVTCDAYISVTQFGEKYSTQTSASLFELVGPTVFSQTGIYLAGQTFDNTLDGNPGGTRTTSTITQFSNGTYYFQVKAFSAVVLEITPTTPVPFPPK